MLSKERLIEIYREWPDEKLKGEYANAEEYEEVAIEAMKTVLIERGFSIEREIPEAYKDTLLLSPDEAMERNKYGDPINNQQLAGQEKTLDGTYFQKTMMVGSKSNLFGFVAAMAITGLICVIVFVISEAVEMWVNMLIVACMIGFTVWAVKILKNNKSEFRLYESRDTLKISITTGNENIELKAPFSYRCYARLEEHYYKGARIKRPNLYILFDLVDGRRVMLHEDQPVTESMPYDWEELGNDYEPLKNDLRLTHHGLGKLELKKLRRILNGLGQKENYA